MGYRPVSHFPYSTVQYFVPYSTVQLYFLLMGMTMRYSQYGVYTDKNYHFSLKTLRRNEGRRDVTEPAAHAQEKTSLEENNITRVYYTRCVL